MGRWDDSTDRCHLGASLHEPRLQVLFHRTGSVPVHLKLCADLLERAVVDLGWVQRIGILEKMAVEVPMPRVISAPRESLIPFSPSMPESMKARPIS